MPNAEDGEPDPMDNMDVPPSDDAGDNTETGDDAPTAPAADTDGDGNRPGLQDLRHRVHAISLDRPPRPNVPSAIAGATGPPGHVPPAERKLAVQTRQVMLSPAAIAALGKYRMTTPEELAVAPE